MQCYVQKVHYGDSDMETSFEYNQLKKLEIQNKRISYLLLSIIIVLQILILYPQIGHGFIKDDFNWIENAAPNGKVDFMFTFTNTTGFFRPLVGLSFGIQYKLFELSPKPYSMFNLFLHLANILLVFFLLMKISKSYFISLLVVFFFSFNFKSVPMAVGWISGRTTLLFSFFILIVLHLYLKFAKNNVSKFKKILFVSCINIFFLLALLSKETAAALPIFVFSYYFFTNEFGKYSFIARIKNGIIKSIVLSPAFIIYFIMRFSSNAFLPYNAPKYYKYTFSPYLIIKNFTEYLSRSSALFIIFIFIVLIIVTLDKFLKKRGNLSVFNSIISPGFYFGFTWFISFLLPVLLVPVRSDLYVYFSQIGLHMTLALILSSIYVVTQKEKIITKTIQIVFFIIIIAQIGSFVHKSFSIYSKGKNSSSFISQLSNRIDNIKKNSEIIVVDYDYKKKNSPSKTISYGLNSFLNIKYPDMKLKGEIITSDENILNNNNNTLLYKWSNNILSKLGENKKANN